MNVSPLSRETYTEMYSLRTQTQQAVTQLASSSWQIRNFNKMLALRRKKLPDFKANRRVKLCYQESAQARMKSTDYLLRTVQTELRHLLTNCKDAADHMQVLLTASAFMILLMSEKGRNTILVSLKLITQKSHELDSKISYLSRPL